MTEARTYDDFIEEAYLKCLRSVLIIDDDYPTLDGLVEGITKPEKPGATQKGWNGANAKDVLAVIQGFRGQEPPLIVDIHDGANVGTEPELEVAKHLHQSDLLVLDFELEKAKRDDGTAAINILRKLAQSSHFNLVMMHSSLEPSKVFEDVVLGLIGEEVDFGQKEFRDGAIAEIEELDPDFLDRLRTALLEDSAAFLEARTDPKILQNRGRWRAQPFSRFDGLCNDLGIRPDIRAATMATFLEEYQDSIKHRFWSAKDIGPITYSGTKDRHRWVKLNTLFIGFTKKRKNVDLVADLKTTLVEWHPQPSRLMLKKLLVELDDRGATAESMALGTKYASAKWYHDLQTASYSEKESHLSETLNRHVQSLLAVIEPEVLNFATDLSKLDSGEDAIQVCKKHFKVNLNDHTQKMQAISEHNLLVSTMPAIRGRQLQTGHIFKLAGDYWICLSAACDLVPGQRNNQRKELYGDDVLPFVAVKLEVAEETTAGNKATDKRFIYLRDGDSTKFFCINAPSGRPGSYLDWHTLFAENLGSFEEGTRILKIIQNKVEKSELVVSHEDAVVVGQLRYPYAVNLAQELSHWISRIGLEFLSIGT